MEIERKFLLVPCSMKDFLEKEGISYRKVPIEQFYLESSEANAERYRRIGERYVHTRKSGGGLVRKEMEREVSREEYLRQKEKNRGGVIEKRRYVFRIGKWTYELDAFKGALKGLNFLEIEFPDPESARLFKLPDPFKAICLDEVTENSAFTNGSISGTMRAPSIEERLSDILSRIDRQRKDFLKASIDVPFHPFESVAHSLKALIYSMARSIQANRVAILAGEKDPERLHQLRVAMRKLRSLLSLMDEYFDPQWLQEHKRRLALLMKATGPKRDLDVYLETFDRYRELLPRKHHAGLERLESYLLERDRELESSLKSFLLGEEIQKELERLLAFSGDDSLTGLSDAAQTPVILPVKDRIFKRYRKILRRGEKVDLHSSAEEFHRLRIDVKKLRYLMEFFSPILEKESFGTMLQRLKGIQTILGDHQDLEIQQQHLKEFSQLPDLKSAEVKASVHALRRAMKKLLMEKRREFLKSFEEFRKSGEVVHRMICRF